MRQRAASAPDGAEEFFAGFTAEANDTSHSRDSGALLVTLRTAAQRSVVPGSGGALMWTHAEPILTSLLAKAATYQSPKRRKHYRERLSTSVSPCQDDSRSR